MPNDIRIKHAKLDEWTNLKKYLDDKSNIDIPSTRDGELWWLAVGENIGIEIDGKSEYFSRPVLVFKTLSPYGFLGVPLTTQVHGGSWYIKNSSDGKKSYFALSQIRVYSAKRLYSKIDRISDGEMKKIRNKLGELYLND